MYVVSATVGQTFTQQGQNLIEIKLYLFSPGKIIKS